MDIDFDLNEAIRASAMLVSYHTSAWTARIPDESAAQAAANQLGITASSLKSHRNLMDGADTRLKAVLSAQKAGRNAHTRLTLPWSTGAGRGPRMLPTSSWGDYMKEIAKHKGVFDGAVQEFLANYPSDSQIAQVRVKLVGDPLHFYPSVDELKRTFDIRLDFTPIPAGAEFKGLPDMVKARLSESYESRMKARFDAAMHEAFTRAHDTLKNLLERLDADEPTFKSAAVENVRELAPLLRGWNLTSDELLASIASAIERLVDGEDMASLKGDDAARKLVIAEGREILKDIEEGLNRSQPG